MRLLEVRLTGSLLSSACLPRGARPDLSVGGLTCRVVVDAGFTAHDARETGIRVELQVHATRQGGAMADVSHPESEATNGSVTISDNVVAKVAHNACREIEGVHALGGAASRALSSLRGESRTQGVSVDIVDDTVDVDVTLVVTYGANMTKVAELCRGAVRTQVEGITGLKVRAVNILVSDVHFPDDGGGASAVE